MVADNRRPATTEEIDRAVNLALANAQELATLRSENAALRERQESLSSRLFRLSGRVDEIERRGAI